MSEFMFTCDNFSEQLNNHMQDEYYWRAQDNVTVSVNDARITDTGWKTLMGIPPLDMTKRIRVIEMPCQFMLQARYHKKRRINKKWLKRYGMVKVSDGKKIIEPSEVYWNKEVDKTTYEFSYSTAKIRYKVGSVVCPKYRKVKTN